MSQGMMNDEDHKVKRELYTGSGLANPVRRAAHKRRSSSRTLIRDGLSPLAVTVPVLNLPTMQKRKFTAQDVHEVYRHWEDRMGDTERLTKKKVEGWLRYYPFALVIKTIGIASEQRFTLPYPQCLNTKKANKHYLTQAFKFIQNYL